MSTQPSPHPKPTAFATLTEYFYCLVVLISMASLLGAIFWLCAPTLAERYWYSFTRSVPTARVFVAQRPTDCYPTATKHCHYQKIVDEGKDSSGNRQITVHWKKVSD